MTDSIGFALVALSSMMAMVDPLGAIPIFLGLTAGQRPDQRRATLRRAIAAAVIVLFTFGLLGTSIFALFGITTEAFRITGGVILFRVGLEMLQAQRSRVKSTEEEEEEGSHRDDVAIIPLAIPLLAGPGSISTVLTLLAQAKSVGARVIVYAVVVGVLLLTYGVLSVAPVIARRLGTTGMNVIERIFGLIVMVIGVQFVIDGTREVLRGLLEGLGA